MKLVVFGLSVRSGLLRSLAGDGHVVVVVEHDAPSHADRAAREIADADVGIVTSRCADAQAASDLVLGSRAHRVYYDLDTFATFAALERGDQVPYLPAQGLGGFDLLLGSAGGVVLESLKNRLGVRRAAPLYPSVDLATHGRGARRTSYASDLSYLGAYAADRQEKVDRLFFEPARAMPDASFLLGGPMYPPECGRPANVTWLAHVPPEDHPAFYGASRATLHVASGAAAATGYCPSRRLFEAAACGAPIVSDDWEGLDELFEPGREIFLARDSRDVLAVLSLREAEVRVVARRARERVLAEHTAQRRARQLIGLITLGAAPPVRKILRAPRRTDVVTSDHRARRTSRA